jgi:phospholipase C
LDPYIQGFFNQTQDTIFDRLNDAGKEWTVYHYDMACSWLLVHQRRAKNLARYKTMGFFFDDAANGDLPPFSFLEPKYNGHDQNDDHPPHNVMKGEKFVADVYNALRTSPQWEKTLLVVLFDEHGGFHDHVPPPKAVPPDEFVKEYAFDRLGVRVPAILVSPWLARGVDHTEFDHTSLLRYLSDKWQLAPLTKRVDAANSIAKAMRFLPSPRQDAVRLIRVRNTDLYAPLPELEEFDQSRHHRAFTIFGEYLSRRRAGTNVEPRPFPNPQFGFRQWMGRHLMGWGRALSTAKTDSAARAAALREEVDASEEIDRRVA